MRARGLYPSVRACWLPPECKLPFSETVSTNNTHLPAFQLPCQKSQPLRRKIPGATPELDKLIPNHPASSSLKRQQLSSLTLDATELQKFIDVF